MAWELRGKAEYYYRSYRIGHRVRKEYVGRGRDANLMAALASQERHQKARAQAELRSEKGAAHAVEQVLDRFDKALGAEVQSQLEQDGYWQHNSGAWRRRRVPKS